MTISAFDRVWKCSARLSLPNFDILRFVDTCDCGTLKNAMFMMVVVVLNGNPIRVVYQDPLSDLIDTWYY